MTYYKPLLWGIGIIFFAGLFITAFMSPFTEAIENEENWVEDYYIVNITGLPFDFIKYPLSGVTLIADFLGGNWHVFGAPTDEIAIKVSGTGTHDSDTLNGVYGLRGIDKDDEEDDYFYAKFRHVDDGFLSFRAIILQLEDSNDTFNINEGIIAYPDNLFSKTVIYETNGTTDDSLTFLWTLTTEGEAYDFNNNATSQYLIDEDAKFSSITQRFGDFMDSGKEKAQEAVLGLGWIPEIIGIPILILILIGIIYGIIKLLPFS